MSIARIPEAQVDKRRPKVTGSDGGIRHRIMSRGQVG